MKANREQAAAAIDAFLRAVGLDSKVDQNLLGTPERVANAYIDELCEGYDVDVASLVTKNLIEGSTDIVVVRRIAVTTTCPHHLMPSVGHGSVVFAPKDKLIGVGTVARVVDAFARRLTLQEQIGNEVVSALMEHLEPHWAGCRLLLSHSCMTARGERRHDTTVETVALAGNLDDARRTFAMQALAGEDRSR